MFTWLPMAHLPQVPDYFLNIASELIQNPPDGDVEFVDQQTGVEQYKNRKLVKDGSVIGSRRQRGLQMPSEWGEWVKKNIVKEYIETSVRVSEGNSTVHGAHCDFRRKWKLYYLLERGGDGATTTFYQQRDFPIVRDEITDLDSELITCNNYGDLTIVDRVQWPLHQWVLLNTMILHGVEGVTGSRSNFTVGIKPDYNLLFNTL